MIGKPLSTRYGALARLPSAQASMLAGRALADHGRDITLVRAQGPNMIACVVLDADDAVVRLLDQLGLSMRAGASAVFGLSGQDLPAMLRWLGDDGCTFVRAAAAVNEVKLLVLSAGYALVSAITVDGKTTLRILA